MSQTFNLGGTITLVNNNQKTVMTLIDSLNTTGSNSIINNASVATGSWQLLSQGSNTNLRYFIATNLDATSSCKIALGSSATASYSAFLNPGDSCVVPNLISNANSVFAEATGSNPTIILQYIALEN